jgi:hypothetical protein
MGGIEKLKMAACLKFWNSMNVNVKKKLRLCLFLFLEKLISIWNFKIFGGFIGLFEDYLLKNESVV